MHCMLLLQQPTRLMYEPGFVLFPPRTCRQTTIHGFLLFWPYTIQGTFVFFAVPGRHEATGVKTPANFCDHYISNTVYQVLREGVLYSTPHLCLLLSPTDTHTHTCNMGRTQ